MKRIIEWLGTNANKARQWVEAGDLILPLIVISVAHYAAVLERKDFWFVAFAIGVLIDLASYRLVKAAIEHGGWFWAEAVVMSLFAFAFHLEFYVGGVEWFYPMAAAAIPTCLIFLAHLSVVEHWERKIKKGLPTEPIRTNGERTANEPQANSAQNERGEKRKRIIDEHLANPSLGVTALAARLGVSKGFVSDTLKAHREHHQVGFKTNG